MKLGRLKRLDLRSHWKHEAFDFTQWLAMEENIELLGDEIGVGIEIIQTEASVGRFNVDILAEEENTGRKIIIENQLEITDHNHLGQLITYASGLEAEYIIWIVRDVREEHRQAVDWLNEHTDDEAHFLLVTLELWQIDESLPAPKFNVICRPNEWKKTIRTSIQEKVLTDTKVKQLAFWQQFKEFSATNYPELKLRNPRPQHWYNVAIGRSDCHNVLIINSKENKVGCELYVPDSKELFQALLESKEDIENKIGVPETLDWQELPGKKASRIRTLYDFDFDDSETWEAAFVWLANMCIRFKGVFSKDWNS